MAKFMMARAYVIVNFRNSVDSKDKYLDGADI